MRSREGNLDALRRVLIVDDHEDSSTMLGTLLELWGYEVRVVQDGKGALALCLTYLPDVILLDINLADMSGYEVATRIRKENQLSEVFLIALTGNSEEDRSGEAGFDYHITKPLDPTILRDLLASRRKSHTA